jgi:hypothetical protein
MYKYNPVTDECSIVDDYPSSASYMFRMVSGEIYCVDPCFKVNIVEASAQGGAT